MESFSFTVRSGNPTSSFEIPSAEVVGGEPAAQGGSEDAQGTKAAERSTGSLHVRPDSRQLTSGLNDVSASSESGDHLTSRLSSLGAEQDPRPQLANVPASASACPQDEEQSDPDEVLILPDDWESLRLGRCEGCGWSGDRKELFRVFDGGRSQDSQLFNPRRREDALQNKLTIDSQSSYQPSCVSCRIHRRIRDKLGPLYGHKMKLNLLKRTESDTNVFQELASGDLWKIFVDQELKLRHRFVPSGFPGGVVVSSDTGSAKAVAWVRSKLTCCLRIHSSVCGGSQSMKFVPTRLIYLAPLNRGGDVVLLEGQDVPAGSSYVAMSHCWGGKIPDCATTRRTLADRKNCIAWKSIPKTFRESMEFTLQLGLEYIWIDSICNLQQDPRDWLREAGMMYNVYKNAYITIGALYAEDCSGGLFSGRDERLQLKLSTVEFKNHRCQLYARRWFPDMQLPGHITDTSPPTSHTPSLFRRAWTFQERMVTPRSVFFAHGELIWDCYDITCCECGSHNHSYLSGAGPKSGYMRLLERRERYIQVTWRRLVSMYSALGLPNPHDKLPAIGAIAEEMTHYRQPKDRYLAGLWSDTLVNDLLWYRCASVATNRSSWTAPTWSWASVQSPVRYHEEVPALGMAFQLKVSVQDAACEYRDGIPYGVAVGGQISLRGTSLPCILRRLKTSAENSLFRFYTLPSGSSHYFAVYADEEPFDAIEDGYGNLIDARRPQHDSRVPASFLKSPTVDMMFDGSYERHYELLHIATTAATQWRVAYLYCLMVSKSPRDEWHICKEGSPSSTGGGGKSVVRSLQVCR